MTRIISQHQVRELSPLFVSYFSSCLTQPNSVSKMTSAVVTLRILQGQLITHTIYTCVVAMPSNRNDAHAWHEPTHQFSCLQAAHCTSSIKFIAQKTGNLKDTIMHMNMIKNHRTNGMNKLQKLTIHETSEEKGVIKNELWTSGKIHTDSNLWCGKVTDCSRKKRTVVTNDHYKWKRKSPDTLRKLKGEQNHQHVVGSAYTPLIYA